MVSVNLILTYTFLISNALGSTLQSWSSKILEPNPPVTDRVIFMLEYHDYATNRIKQAEIAMEVYGTVAPKTVRNFVEISGGVKARIQGKDPDDIVTITYKDTFMHRIVSNSIIQGGDVLPDIGPFSIYGSRFPDETFDLKHDRPGRISMANSGTDSNGSQFFITTSSEPMDHLDGKHVVFGQVIGGLDVLLEVIQHLPVDENNKPLKSVKVRSTYVDSLQILDKDSLHSSYLETLKKFRNGDTSVGVTMGDILKQNDKPLNTKNGNFYGELFYFLLKIGSGLVVLSWIYSLTKYARRTLSHSEPNVISMRHE